MGRGVLCLCGVYVEADYGICRVERCVCVCVCVMMMIILYGVFRAAALGRPGRVPYGDHCTGCV